MSEKRTKKEVGEINIANSGEICYYIEFEFFGCGYAIEALEFAKQYAKKGGLKPYLRIRTFNRASKTMTKRNGFVQKGFMGYFEL